MQTRRRQLSLALLGLPLAGCAYRPLPDLRTEPAATPAPIPPWRTPATGQRWTYRKYNGYNGELLATEEHEVMAIDPLLRIRQRNISTAATQEEVQLAGGRLVQRDPAWDHAQNHEPALPLWPVDLSPGARSVHRGGYRIDGQSYRYWITQHTQVHGWEAVTLPQGRVRALRVEHFIKLDHPDFSRYETTRHDTLWLAPEIGRWVAREITGEYLKPSDPGAFRGLEAHHRWELVSWV